MAKLVKRSERDETVLARVRALGPPPAAPQPERYGRRVVIKPWGYEFLVFENELAAVWFLHIQPGHSTSMHCHPRKKTALAALAGKGLCNTFYNRNYLKAAEAVVLEEGVFHATQALSAEGLDLIEIESPPEKSDLVRLEDQYGREGCGYEGLSEMRTEGLERFGWFNLVEPAPGAAQLHRHGAVDLVFFAPAGAWRPEVPGQRAVYCSCRGRALSSRGEMVLDVGEAAELSYLEAFEGLDVKGPAAFLMIALRDENG